VYSAEGVQVPITVKGQLGGESCEPMPAAPSPRDLSCHGYGSTVVVTATFGMTAAGECLRQLVEFSG
jgi:tRNA A37 threonylcarbamoyladenosine dehydratase